MAAYTNNEVGTIQNYSVYAYYNEIPLGILESGEHSWTIEAQEVNPITSSLYGQTPLGFTTSGAIIDVTLTINSVSKHLLKDIYSDLLKAIAGGEVTSATDGYDGSLELMPYVGQRATNKLVFYPIFTDTKGVYGVAGTKYEDSITNPLALSLDAVCTSELAMAFDASEYKNFELTFSGVLDVTTERLAAWTKGTATDGTISFV